MRKGVLCVITLWCIWQRVRPNKYSHGLHLAVSGCGVKHINYTMEFRCLRQWRKNNSHKSHKIDNHTKRNKTLFMVTPEEVVMITNGATSDGRDVGVQCINYKTQQLWTVRVVLRMYECTCSFHCAGRLPVHGHNQEVMLQHTLCGPRRWPQGPTSKE